MLPGFNDITQPLTEEEMQMVPIFIKGLSTLVGEENAMTNRMIAKKINEKYGYKITDTRVRKIIHYIRVKKLVRFLISSSKGYFILPNIVALKKYKQSLVGRNEAVSQVIHSVDDDIKFLERKQQSPLFTQ